MIKSLIVSLFLTIIIELSISIIIGIRDMEDMKTVIWSNIFTNPIVVYSANCIRLLNNSLIYKITLILLEVIVVIVEFYIFKKFLKFNRKSPIFISCINNVVSFLLGTVISKILF